jgi:hypothetical protein
VRHPQVPGSLGIAHAEALSFGDAFIILGAKPSAAQKPQAIDTPPHFEGDDQG